MSYAENSSFLSTAQWALKSSSVRSSYVDGVGVVSYKGILYAMGGWNGTSTPTTNNDIYKSTDDGTTWTFLASAPWTRRHSFVYFVSSDGFIYVIGSDLLTTGNADAKEVWRSDDIEGNNWAQMTSNAAFGIRGLHAGFEHEGILYVLGGQSAYTTGTGLNDVWKSTDGGQTWTQVATGVNVGGTSFLGQNISNQVKVFNGRAYCVGGGVYDNNPSNRTFTKKVYSADLSDLTTWKAEADLPFSTGRQYMCVEVWDGKLWAIAGNDSNGNTNDVAFMDKAETWHIYNHYVGTSFSTVLSATHAAGICVHNDQLYRILGNGTTECFALRRDNVVFPEGDYQILNGTVNSPVKVFIGNNGSAGTLGINLEGPGYLASGKKLDVRGDAQIRTNSFGALVLTTDTINNNAIGLGLNGGGTNYYLGAGGVTGSYPNAFFIYQGSTNYLPLVVTNARNTIVANDSGTFTDNGHAFQIKRGHAYADAGNFISKPFDLTDATTITVDASKTQEFRVTITANRTMGNPSNAVDGMRIRFRIKQGTGGSYTITWDTKYRFGSTYPSPTLSTTVNYEDYVEFVYNGTDDKWDCINIAKGFA